MSELASYYSRYYENRRDDSHPAQVGQLVKKVCEIARAWRSEGYEPDVLDIGSGPRVVANELEGLGLNAWSVDFSDVGSLAISDGADTKHIRGDGSYLPFPDESIDIVVSNMAMDLMPRRAFEAAMRVLVSGGVFVANFHHPRLCENIDASKRDVARRIRTNQQKLRFAKNGTKSYEKARQKVRGLELEMQALDYRRDHMPGVLFQNERQMSAYMDVIGRWSHLDVSEERFGNEVWWHVAGVKR